MTKGLSDNEQLEETARARNSPRRLASWRSGQKAKRARMLCEGQVQLRIWCTPEEAERVKGVLKQWRQDEIDRRQRLRQAMRRLKL